MLEMLRAVARFISEKIGWHRIGFALSLVIIVTAGVVLYRMLRTIDINEVLLGVEGDRCSGLRPGGAFRRRRLFHADLLRPVRGAHDRPRAICPIGLRRSPASPAIRSATMSAPASSPAGRCAIASIPRMAVTRARGRENLFRRRPHLLARQRHRAGPRHFLCAGGGQLRSTSCPPWFNRVLGGDRRSCRARRYVAWVWVRPRVIGRGDWQVTLPGGPLTLAADRDRHRRSRAAAPRRCICCCRTSRISASSRWR